MKFVSLALALAGLYGSTQAYVVNLYSDQNCQVAAGTRNVYDNTCAYTGGFQSFILTAYGGEDQGLTAYSRNACAGDVTQSGMADDSGIGSNPIWKNQCFSAYNGNGGSNALSSYAQ